MKRIPTLFEVILSITLLSLGCYLLYEGSSDKATPALLICGAACFTFSAMILVSVTRSILWHRHMLRHSMSDHDEKPR